MTKNSAPILVAGGGLAGVATLLELVQRGHDAMLFEGNEHLGHGASFANGAMLTPSMPDPWNGPGVGRHLLSSLFAPNASMKLNVSQIPDLMGWGIRFLAASRTSQHRASTLANFRLCAKSLVKTERLIQDLGLDCDFSNTGTLKIFTSRKAMAGPLAVSQSLEPEGLLHEALSAREAVDIEPQLHAIEDRIAGAIRYPGDRVGDAHKFVQALAAAAEAAGGTIHRQSPVDTLKIENGRVVGLISQGMFFSGQVVLCAGVDSPQLAKTIGLSLPIKPAKGYSLTVDAKALGADMPKVAVIDDHMHAAVVPVGDRLRFVGTAEFAGFDRSIRQPRIDNLLALFRRIYPHLASQLDLERGQAWAGLRPMTPNGQPLIGSSAVPGLWLNCGHGHLGWTMAMGSAERLVDAMEGATIESDTRTPPWI